MKYIAVGIDSEHYSDLYYEFVETENEGKDFLEKTFSSMHWGEDAEMESESFVDRGFVGCDIGWWAVGEIHKVDKEYNVIHWYYNVIHWHAYNGVGFEVKGFDTLKEARQYLAEDTKKYLETIDCTEWDISLDSAIIDNDYEWNMWQIVRPITNLSK